MSSSESSSSSGTSAAVVPKKRKHEIVALAEKETDSNTPNSDVNDGSAKADEPVLSHAEKRRRKRDAKHAELKDTDAHPKKKRKLKDESSKAIDSSANSIRQNS